MSQIFSLCFLMACDQFIKKGFVAFCLLTTLFTSVHIGFSVDCSVICRLDVLIFCKQ